MSDNPPTRAAKAAGGQSKLARLLNIKPQAVQHWCTTGKIPAERVLSVEEATGIPRHELRPDLYPNADSKSAA
ncbi:transcriptional regulator [Pseudomonas sp. LS.1a]|uniref:transcriptional regulator n=1 Tax=Pseudomonas sp. LS.1a TaxID=2920387 RepID=UPI001F145962|nr:Cro/CI family transcriptional regulator [Pseudomonas sp. LS.1a]UMY63911.1 helix-turn-helix domain-containing protein [Pseudomonas sp. LS.1a]